MAGATNQLREQELKLDAPETFNLPELPGEPLASRLFTSTYYDTDDRRLVSAGMTLRRRVEQGKSVWQLKLPRDDYRLEVEAPGGPVGPPAALADALVAVARGGGFAPVATLRTRREGVRVAEDGSALADVVLDHVSILDGRRTVGEFREVEVELLDGGPGTLRTLGKDLRRAGATIGDGRSKLARTLALDPPVSLDPKAPAADHLEAFLRQRLVSLLSHDAGVRLGGPPEELHQLRVASRRLRAALRAATPIVLRSWAEPLRVELGWLGTELGKVRDLDVLTERLRAQAAELDHADGEAFEPVLDSLERERTERAAELAETLRSPRYLELVAELERAVAAPQILDRKRPVRELARSPFRRLGKAVAALGDDPTDAELHRVRILGKRARYAAELAEAAEGKTAAKFVRAAKEFQDVLGEHQDSAVAEERLRELARDAESAAALAAGRLVERQRAARAQARAGLPRAWSRLERAGAKAWK
jgi:CHAD domain-containing protein